MHIAMFESIHENQKVHLKNSIEVKLEEMKIHLAEFDDSEYQKHILGSVETAEEFFANLQKLEAELEEICDNNMDKTSEGVKEEISKAVKSSEKVKRVLAIDIRIKKRNAAVKQWF